MPGIDFKYHVEGLEALTKKYPEASRQARIGRLAEALLLLEREVKEHTPYGAGPVHLKDTIFADPPFVRGQAVVGILGTPAVYAEPVELGSKAHFPPVDPLEFWVEKVLGLQGKEARAVAWAIAVTISKRGSRPRHMFKGGLDENRAKVESILDHIPADIVRLVEAGS